MLLLEERFFKPSFARYDEDFDSPVMIDSADLDDFKLGTTSRIEWKLLGCWEMDAV